MRSHGPMAPIGHLRRLLPRLRASAQGGVIGRAIPNTEVVAMGAALG
jgi:hypothetical protein